MPDPRADDLWQQVMARWADDDAHAAFLDHCRAEGQLGEAARRYRDEIKRASAYRDDPTRVETAEKRLRGITALALLEMSKGAPSYTAEDALRARSMFRWSLIVLLILGLIVASLRSALR